ncbi:YSIRK-type signal peptide-containing protein, partial [Streptococcus sp. SO4]|uniref:mucin-binding protein n=1 Tax=Streptococcus sp. SO4 TaxID=3018249 RepID=UPI00263D37E3
MKNYFSERQRFSLRKYSFGLASVLLGTAFFLSGQVASADETPILDRVAVAEASDQQTVASDQQSIPTKKTVDEEAVETTFSEASAGIQESQKTTNNSENSKLNDQISKVDEETTPENKVDVQKTETLDSATSVQNEESKNSYKKSDNSSELKGDYTENKVSDSRLNRSRRAISENGWSSHEIDPKDLSFKAVNIPVISGQYVTRDDINGIKIETDMFDIPWTYNYVIVSKSSNGGEARHRIINIYYKNLGTISFVDSDGNSISGVTTSKVFKNTNNTFTSDDGTPVPDPSDAAITELPKLPAGYRLKTVDGDPTKVEAYIDRQTSDTIYDYSEIHTNEVIDPDSLTPDELDESLKKYPAPKISSETWSLNKKETVTLIRQPDGTYALDPSIAGNGGNQFAPGTRYRFVIEKDSSQIQQATSQTVTYTGAETNPPQNLQNDFTFTGEENSQTHDKTWKKTSHTYGEVLTPVVTGYYADKTSAGKKTVTPDQPHATDTVTYKKLGKIIQVDEAGNVIPGSVSKTYENNPVDPTQAAETKIPDAPAGYKIKEEQPQAWGYNIVDKTIEPNDESDPDRISRDTPIIYVPIVNDVTKPTKQTVTFEGAGVDTPTTNVQDSFTFTGKHNPTTNTTTWNEFSHTYGKLIVPVVDGYYSDKTEAGSKTVTPDQPEVTDHVVYKPLGKIIQVDEAGNVIPGSVSRTYENNPVDPTQAAETKIPDAPAGYKIRENQPQAWGYNIVDKTIEPNDESDPDRISRDTPIVYVPIVDKVTKPTKQTVTFEGAGTATPAPDVQSDFTFTGKQKQADGTIAWDQPSHTYGKVIVPVVEGFYSDKAEAGSKVVTPDQPEVTDHVIYKPLGSLVPKSDDPKFPSTPKVKYPNDPTDPTKPSKPIVPNVPGYKPYLPDPNDPTKPDTDKPVEPGKELPNLPTNPGDDTPIIYVPIVNDVTKPTKQTVTFEGAGVDTPTPNVQSDFTFTGKQKQADGTITWDQTSHTYGKVIVPVVDGYYSDKTEAGSKVVTPDQPEVTDHVIYKPLGSLVPKSDDPKFPSTPNVKYPNDPTDPTKPTKPIV